MIQKKYDLILFLSFTLLSGESHSFAPTTPSPHSKKLFEFILPLNDDEKHEKVQMRKYDKHQYELAYKIYIQNKNVKSAFAVALSAVKQNPENKLWRERLAQSAAWNKEFSIALGQYLYLLRHFKDENAGATGMQLAKSIHDDNILVQFLLFYIGNRTASEKLWQDYVDAMLRLGEIQKLIDTLNSNQNQVPIALYLGTLSKVYKVTDNPETELAVLNRLSSILGMVPMVAEQMSDIYMNHGNITQAYRVLSQARKNAHPKDVKFWEAYAQVSHLMNKQTEELYATQQLVKNNRTIPVYSRLVEITYRDSPDLAYRYAQQARKLFPNNYYFTSSLISLMADKKQSLDFSRLTATTPASVMQLLRYENTYWRAQANYWKKVGNDNEVIQTYLSGMKFLPADDHLKADFIYYLIKANNLTLLKQILPLWQAQVPHKPDLWGAYAESYARINDNPMMTRLILSLFYDQFSHYDKNPYWLILFKDVLENSFLLPQSNEINRYAWPLYLNLIKNQPSAMNDVQLVDYVKLSLLNAAGDPTAAALSVLQHHENEEVEELMLAWALGHNNISLAKAVYSHYKNKGMEPPPWAHLSIALAHNDRQAMRNILMDKRAVVSYRDHVQAADRIDAIPLAQEVAYKSLRKNRKDSDLYDNFFTPVMLKTSNDLSVSQEYYQYGDVDGPRTKVAYTYFLSPGISLTPYNSIWFTHNIASEPTPRNDDLNNINITNQTFATVPAKDERAGIRISTLQQRGKLNFDLGYRDNLNSFMTAKVKRTYLAYSDLNLYGSLGYHQQADDTASLLIGGMRNNMVLGFNYRLLAKDFLSGEYDQNAFYTQDGQYLSDGSQFTLRYDHKFWLTYPDWTLSPYGTVSQYYNKSQRLLTGNVLTLIPEGNIPNVNFFIPANFTEYGLTFSFGQKYIKEYTHRWRPFSSVTLSQNSVVGVGKLFNVGIAGSVLGRDHLLIYYEWGTNQGQGLQSERLVKISYRIYT